MTVLSSAECRRRDAERRRAISRLGHGPHVHNRLHLSAEDDDEPTVDDYVKALASDGPFEGQEDALRMLDVEVLQRLYADYVGEPDEEDDSASVAPSVQSRAQSYAPPTTLDGLFARGRVSQNAYKTMKAEEQRRARRSQAAALHRQRATARPHANAEALPDHVARAMTPPTTAQLLRRR
jgi:hypothetical protein